MNTESTQTPESLGSQHGSAAILREILRVMEDLSNQHPDDIFWVGSCETLYERLYGIYADFGGDMDELHEKFPEMA